MTDPRLLWTPAPAEHRARLARLAARAREDGLDAVVVGPGADMRFLLGRSQGSHERFTGLVVPADGEPFLVVPQLERPGWTGSTAERVVPDMPTWQDGESAHCLVAARLGAGARIGVDDLLPSVHALGLGAALGAAVTAGGPTIRALRMVKTPEELVGPARGRRGRRPRPRPHWRMTAPRAHRGRDRRRHRRGARRGGARARRLRHRRLRPPRGEPPPRAVRPRRARRRARRRRHRRAGAQRLLQRLDPHLRVRRAGRSRVRPRLADRPGRPARRHRRRPGRSALLGGRRRRPQGRRGRRLRRLLHHPHRARHRAGGARAPVPRARRRPAPGPGHDLLVEPGIYLPGRFGVRIEDIVAIGDDGSPEPCNRSPRHWRPAGDPGGP